MTDLDRIETVPAPRYRPGLFAAFPRRVPAQRVVTERVVEDVPVAVADARVAPHLTKDAYERGRRDERARRHRSPVLGVVLMLIAAAGGVMVFLAAREGSFASGGHVVDSALTQAAQPAKDAAAHAGDALENAGRTLKQNAGDTNAPN